MAQPPTNGTPADHSRCALALLRARFPDFAMAIAELAPEATALARRRITDKRWDEAAAELVAALDRAEAMQAKDAPGAS
jgi:hypothetical protein